MVSSAESDDDRPAAPEDAPGRKRRRASTSSSPPAPSRRGFQKLWTDADEIAILQGFWDFTSRRGTARADCQHDTGPFYEEIRGRLRLDFTRSQLVEKLRRLKRKYRNMVRRIAADRGFIFRSPHEEATFEIAGKIWSPIFKSAPNPQGCDLDGAEAPKDGAFDADRHSNPRPRRRLKKGAEVAAAADTAAPPTVPHPDMVEQTLRSCLSPLFNELLHCSGIGHGVTALNRPSNILPVSSGVAAGKKWKQQQILELEVYLKRLELVHEHIKSKLEELKSKESS